MAKAPRSFLLPVLGTQAMAAASAISVVTQLAVVNCPASQDQQTIYQVDDKGDGT